MTATNFILGALITTLVVLVVRRLTKKKKPYVGSGLFTIPDGVTHVEIQMVGGGGGGSDSGAAPAMLGLSKQIEQDMYTTKIDEERPLVDVPLQAKPRKKKAYNKKAPKKKSKKKTNKRKK